MKKCPYCAEEIQDEAVVCRYCGRDLNTGATATPAPAPPVIVQQVAPKKKSSPAAILLLLIVVALLAMVALGSSRSGGSGSSIPVSAPRAAETYKVTYRISGPTSKASLTYENASGGTEQITVSVPWEKSFNAVPGDFLYISAQNEYDYGGVKCEILVNGIVVKDAKSNGAYVIATCSGRL